ncbi:UDP-N-Acetylglucosamine 2-epimerase [Selenihalanaerobacter shriftii]|uniref:UDP-N-acetylglucosamine 2-epimerase (non-hydrolyzing) n=2 Tax=Selenihalanaerobacter shriftii TaxID=142842 RepID=A0A1T4L0M2_9FIRM|nr:UDP-N-Acetylglucosamine 2-epimerase [Selenihalanaerobacter shriftii]
MAPVIKELKKCQDIKPLVITTAQHRELLDQVLELFHLKPDYDLDIMQTEQSLNQITIRILQQLDPILEKENPDMLLVHGDTTTTFVTSLAGYYNQLPIGHIEAGLRTYDKYRPFPEEMNRHLTGVLSDLHFAPTGDAKDNLLKEGIPEERIFVTGNTVIDALLKIFKGNYKFTSKVLNNIDFKKRKQILITAHRRENLGQPLIKICQAVKMILEQLSDVEVIFPVHPNPKVQRIVNESLGEESRVYLINPLSYNEFVNLMGRVDIILTDSGGIQEEAPSLGKPVLVLREKTERPEAVNAGTVRLVGHNSEQIINESIKLLNDEDVYSQMAQIKNPYGDGKAAKYIKEILITYFR